MEFDSSPPASSELHLLISTHGLLIEDDSDTFACFGIDDDDGFGFGIGEAHVEDGAVLCHLSSHAHEVLAEGVNHSVIVKVVGVLGHWFHLFNLHVSLIVDATLTYIQWDVKGKIYRERLFLAGLQRLYWVQGIGMAWSERFLLSKHRASGEGWSRLIPLHLFAYQRGQRKSLRLETPLSRMGACSLAFYSGIKPYPPKIPLAIGKSLLSQGNLQLNAVNPQNA